MLRLHNRLDTLDFGQLMLTYEEWNKMNGASRYPECSENLQILYAEQDFYFFLKDFFKNTNAVYCVWEDCDKYTAALRLEPYLDGHLLEALETMPTERRKGHAMRLVRAVLQYLPGTGANRIYSHVAKDNAASLYLHQKCGFSVISNEAVFIDNSYHPDYYTLLYKC